MSAPERLTINRDADSAFARLASKTWLKTTDDHPVPDELGDAPEAYFRFGMLIGFQLVAVAAQSGPKATSSREVRDALKDAIQILNDELDEHR